MVMVLGFRVKVSLLGAEVPICYFWKCRVVENTGTLLLVRRPNVPSAEPSTQIVPEAHV